MKNALKTFGLAIASTMGVAIGNYLAPILIEKTTKVLKNLKNNDLKGEKHENHFVS